MRIFILLLSIIFILSCNEADDNLLQGQYTGTFTVNYQNQVSHSGDVTITFTDNNYSSTGNSNYFPAGGSGIFSIVGTQAIFNDENFWTANFDWNLILSGEYLIELNDNQLILTKTIENFGVYTYTLSKQ